MYEATKNIKIKHCSSIRNSKINGTGIATALNNGDDNDGNSVIGTGNGNSGNDNCNGNGSSSGDDDRNKK